MIFARIPDAFNPHRWSLLARHQPIQISSSIIRYHNAKASPHINNERRRTREIISPCNRKPWGLEFEAPSPSCQSFQPMQKFPRHGKLWISEEQDQPAACLTLVLLCSHSTDSVVFGSRVAKRIWGFPTGRRAGSCHEDASFCCAMPLKK